MRPEPSPQVIIHERVCKKSATTQAPSCAQSYILWTETPTSMDPFYGRRFKWKILFAQSEDGSRSTGENELNSVTRIGSDTRELGNVVLSRTDFDALPLLRSSHTTACVQPRAHETGLLESKSSIEVAPTIRIFGNCQPNEAPENASSRQPNKTRIQLCFAPNI
jgi:hypothetical protein